MPRVQLPVPQDVHGINWSNSLTRGLVRAWPMVGKSWQKELTGRGDKLVARLVNAHTSTTAWTQRVSSPAGLNTFAYTGDDLGPYCDGGVVPPTLQNGNARTTAMWAYKVQYGGRTDGGLFEYNDGGVTAGRLIYKVQNASGNLRVATTASYDTSLIVPLNELCFICYVTTGDTIGDHTVYLNDTSEGCTGTSTFASTSSFHCHIGAIFTLSNNGAVPQQAWGDSLFNVMVWDRALKNNEILALYNNGKPRWDMYVTDVDLRRAWKAPAAGGLTIPIAYPHYRDMMGAM